MTFSEAFLEWERQTQERMKQQARQEVRQEVRQEMALSLLSQGFPIEVVAQATSLLIDEVQSLQSQQQQ